MAAIGTVADLAPMTGESRAIVRLGLAEMAETQRAGLRALLSRACESPEQATARDLGYNVAPRINAAGRIAEAELAISLLLEEDVAAAERLADELEAVHRPTPRAHERGRGGSARHGRGPRGHGTHRARHDAWAPGIVGLIAGRLADTLERPVAVAAPAGDELRGSVRCPVDFHAAAALEACATLLIKRGGHAAAGGFSVAMPGWDPFVAAFQALPRPFPPSSADVAPAGRLTIDLVLPAAHLGWELADQIERLAPFGPGHVEPLLAVTGLRVGDARRVGLGCTASCAAHAVGAPRPSMPSASGRRPTVRSRRKGAWSTWSAPSSATRSRDSRACACGSGLRRELAESAGRSTPGCPALSLQPVPMAAPAGATTT